MFIGLVIGLLLGFFLARYLVSQQKFGDKKEVLDAQWGKKLMTLEKDYELKLEKSKSDWNKLKEENNTTIEKVNRNWETKYIQDIEELKRGFKESEKIIKKMSVSGSRRTLIGKFIEKFVPF